MDAVAFPVALLGISLISCVDLVVHERRTRYGQIRLPKDEDEQDHSRTNGAADGDYQIGSNHNDATNDNDDADSLREQEVAQDEGEPVDEDKWWLKVRLRKGGLVISLALLNAIACLSLGWDVTSRAKPALGIVEDALMVGFWVRQSSDLCTDSSLQRPSRTLMSVNYA